MASEIDKYKWLGNEFLSEMEKAAKLDSKQLKKILSGLEGRVKSLGQDFTPCSDSADAQALKTKIDTRWSTLQKQAAARPVGLLDVPAAVLTLLAATTERADIPALSRTCRLFRDTFTHLAKPTDRNLVLSQVIGCQTLTSMKTLKKQVEALNRDYTNYLGEGKKWTLVEVLKRYSLRTIDFSKNGITVQEFDELMLAFQEIRSNMSPINQKVMAQPYVTLGGRKFPEALSKDQVIRIGHKINTEIGTERGPLVLPPAEDVPAQEAFFQEFTIRREMYTKKIMHLKTHPDVLVPLLRELFPDMAVVLQKGKSVNLYGDIRRLDFGNLRIFRPLNPFLRAFCSNLTHLSAPKVRIDIELLKDLQDSLVYVNLGEAGREVVSSNAGFDLTDYFSPKIEYLSLPFVPDPDAVLGYAKGNSKLTKAQVNLTAAEWKDEIVTVLEGLAKSCPNINTLAVSCFQNSHSIAFEAIPDQVKVAGEVIGKFKKLTHLVIQSDWGTAGNLLNLVKHAKSLQRLTIDCNYALIEGEWHRFSQTVFPEELFKISQILPDLKIVVIRAYVSGSDKEIARLIAKTGAKIQFLLEEGAEEHQGGIKNGLILLIELNRILKSADFRGRDFFDELQKLHPHLLGDIYRIMWIHAGMPTIPDFGKRTVQDNPEILRDITLPWVSLKGGNLLEQMIEREFERTQFSFSYGNAGESRKTSDDLALYSHYRSRLQALEALMGDKNIKQGQLCEVFKGLDQDLQNMLGHRLWLAHNKPDEMGYGEKRIAQDVRCLQDVVAKMIPALPVLTFDMTDADRLKGVHALLKGELFIQEELLGIYNSFTHDLRVKMATNLWIEHGKPDELQFGENRIKKDVRSLIAVVENLLKK